MSPKQASRSASPDLHGNAPDTCPIALLLVDVINEFAFRGAQSLVKRAVPAAREMAALKQRASRANVPCVYANDNFGRWRSDFHTVVQHCGRQTSPGAAVVELLRPKQADYFVLKPKHSGFYQTCLGVLLERLGVRTVIIMGFSTESCVSFTAHDAYLRDLQLVVPRDTTASCDSAKKRTALAHLEASLSAHTPLSEEIAFVGKGKRAKLKIAGKQVP
jgi:nicotinamidase-related amidase